MSEEITIKGKLLKELRVSELKSACKHKNLPSGGNKAALVKRLKAAIELENLQKAARNSPNTPTLPNSDIAADSGENDFIKQYMENQRKLLQSQQHRFSSASEADSEDDASSQKNRSMISPLTGLRTRSLTSESNEDSSHRGGRSSESEPTADEDAKVTVQATVTSIQEAEREDCVEQKIDAKPEIPKSDGDVAEEPEQTKAEEPQPPSVEQKEDDDDVEVNGNGVKAPVRSQDHDEEIDTFVRPEVSSRISLSKESKSPVEESDDMPSVEKLPKANKVSAKSEPPEKDEAVVPGEDGLNAAIEKQEGHVEQKNSETQEESAEVEKTMDEEHETQAEKIREDIMEMDSGKKDEEIEEAAPPAQEEHIETVVDVDVMVNQEEELDYDENEASQEKCEVSEKLDVAQNDEENKSEARSLRRLKLRHPKKEKKERRRSRSDTRREEERLKEKENEETGDAGEDIKEETDSKQSEHSLRKRRKSSTAAEPDVQVEKTPEAVEKKTRKRLKRQSLDVNHSDKEGNKSQQEEQPRKEKEEERDVEMKTDTVTPAEPEISLTTEKEDEPVKPLRPLRRISINKKKPSQTEEHDACKNRKRKWGSRRNLNTDTVNISSDLIKNLIDVKPDELRKAMDDADVLVEEPGELVEEEEVDEVLDISTDDIDQQAIVAASSSSDVDTAQRSSNERAGEEDGEIVEEEELVVEEVLETESGAEEDAHGKLAHITQHDNRKVVSSKSSKNDTKTKRTISRTDEKKGRERKSSQSAIGDEANEKELVSPKQPSKKPRKGRVTITHKTSPKDPSPPPEPREVSPARSPQTKILHVRNLVRPFTVNQLKALLGKVGQVVEDTFWIDKIKSHCLITYVTEDDAVNARKCLHGITWPASNPKRLFVDFSSTKEDETLRGIAPTPSTEPAPEERRNERRQRNEKTERIGHRQPMEEEGPKRGRDRHEKDNATARHKSPAHSPKRRREEQAKGSRREGGTRDMTRKRSPERRRKDDDRKGGRRERGTRVEPMQQQREWDRHKLDPEAEPRRQQRDRERERRPEGDKREQRRQKEEPKVEEPPAKLLDDLFRKTKATPCIYWLPMTEEQILLREKERQERREARAKLRQETDEQESVRSKGRPVSGDRARRNSERRQADARPRRESTNERGQDRNRAPVRLAEQGGGKNRPTRGSPPVKRSPARRGQKTEAAASSASSSSDSSSDSSDESESGSESDSESEKSSGSPSPKKKAN